MAESDSERTEEPSPERRRKAREEGQFARGKDAGNTVAGVLVLCTLAALGDDIVKLIGDFAARCYGQPYDLIRGDPKALLHAVASTVASIVLPVAGAAALGALVLGVAEAGYHPNLQLAAPKWQRLDPLPKLKQMFMFHEMVMEVALQLARVLVVGFVAYRSVKDTFPRLMQLNRVDLPGGVVEILAALFKLALWSSLALSGLALVDYLKSYRKHEASIRMSRQELKEEMKQQEGDQRIKQRLRARARDAAKRGMRRAVESSDFVIANPTHISVAIRYRVDEGAPIVTVKGYDEIALYIRTLAKENGIPVIENRALARALAKRVKAGRPVPVDLYAAVAEILAFVYRLKNRSLASLTGKPRLPRPGARPERRPVRGGNPPSR
jgi:flagellar biosynthesis protein FlhB